ncbi:MAG: ABC transporter permease subunit [Oscillospiraceae bacterium]|jgi:putative aldouronate transport system permease protein|nr:ABC transporter permease subunit [Oscillospiraceae bacterium]
MAMTAAVTQRRVGWGKYLYKNRWLYLMSVPGLAFLILFKYIPIYGVVMAFQDFKFKTGVFGSPFNHFKHFVTLFSSDRFYRVLTNSITLSSMRLVASFPVPVLLALLLNEIHARWFKRCSQTLMYLPHFISWVVLSGIVVNFLSMNDGLVNDLIQALGGKKVNFLGSSAWFRAMIIGTNIWKEAGWGTVIYLASLASINPEYYEAATVDGANRFQKIRYVTIPGVSGTIVIMLVLAVGGLMNNGFEQIYLFQNDLNISVSDIFETYTYNIGVVGGQYSYSTAVGLFKNMVGAILIFTSNTLAKRLGGATLY